MTTRPFGIRSHEELAARSLDRIQGLKVTRATHLDGNRAILTLQTEGGRKFSLTIAVIEHLAGTLPDLVSERAERQVGVGAGRAERVVSASKARQYGDKSHWDVRELEDEGLPLYWNQEWLETELARLGTLAAVGREHGYKTSTLQNWAHEYGHVRRPRKPEAKRELLEFWAARDPLNPPTIKSLAERFGLSVGWTEETLKRAELGQRAYRAEQAQRRKQLEQKRNLALTEWDRGERNVLRISTRTGLARSALTKLLKEKRGYKPRERKPNGAGQRHRKAGTGGTAPQG